MPLENDLNRWREHLRQFAALLGNPPDTHAAPHPEQPAPLCLVCAPHPDDECVIGALPLRLRQEAGWRVTNVAMTLGSRPERRAERWTELLDACAVLGFGCIRFGEDSLAQVRLETASEAPALWASHVAAVAELFARERPALVTTPHEQDDNPTHRGVYRLIVEALAASGIDTVLACTEFWSTQAAPNALVETNVDDTARLILALERHAGEVARNPYHLRMPAYLSDAVRRGGELVNGAGAAPPDAAFGTLYRLVKVRKGQLAEDLPRRVLPASETLGSSILAA